MGISSMASKEHQQLYKFMDKQCNISALISVMIGKSNGPIDFVTLIAQNAAFIFIFS